MSSVTIPIIEAIRNKRLLAFDYHGSGRIVEPHTYGTDRWQREVLCAYQIEGVSRSGNPQGWRNFVVSDLSGMRVLARHFEHPRPEYRPNDGAFQKILAQL